MYLFPVATYPGHSRLRTFGQWHGACSTGTNGMAKILLVEDEPLARESTSIFLELEGHEVYQAVDGIEALDSFARHDFALVVSDIKLPRLDGIRLIRELRKIRPTLPIVVITAYSSRAPDGIPVLTKPLILRELSRKIEELLA